MSDSENRILDADRHAGLLLSLESPGPHRETNRAALLDHDEALRAALATAQDALDATPPHKRAWRFDVLRLEAALATAEAERDDIIVRYGNSEHVWLDERREHLAAEARVAALTEALREYGAHRIDCAWTRWSRRPTGSAPDCTCGLARALLVGEPDLETTT